MSRVFARYLLSFTWVAATFSAAIPVATQAQESKAQAVPSWIWLGNASDNKKVSVRHEFKIEDEVAEAMLFATADNHCEVFINNKKILSSDEWEKLAMADIRSELQRGTNVIAMNASNDGGAAGLIASIQWTMKDGTKQAISTGPSWKGIAVAAGHWKEKSFDDSGWSEVAVLGEIGGKGLPWSRNINMKSFGLTSPKSSIDEFRPEVPEYAHVPNGFKIEKIFDVPKSMGSWVSLTTDHLGRLIASDQGDEGLFLITPGTDSVPTKVERLPVDLSGAQGLLWAFDSLYAMVNGGNKSGLHRLRDTDGDGKVDSDEFCMRVPGGGEHGPHAVILSPDGKSLYIVAGNHTKLPDAIVGSRIPQNWNEDHLLPRRWDANGHAAGILAPGGWICNVDPSGKEWTVFSIGYRNQYDIAFNREGELFSYDADMEWDFGSPWYRPTRVCHATSGSEFGWRSGTGKWPAYYEDSLPSAIDIGPGSPTGIVFGTGAKFPAQYQKSLFILDWTYSTIYSIELTPDGASYNGKKSDFVTGSPLPVTDAVVGTDGALYFSAGGRGTESSLYRVTYVGSESTSPVSGIDAAGLESRTLRRRLEAMHGHGECDFNLIFSNLSNDDRFIRYAARVALENQPIALWRAQSLTQKKPMGIIDAMLAIAHQGNKDDLNTIVEHLFSLDFKTLGEHEKLAWLRTYEVAFARHGEPSDEWREKLIGHFDSFYPASSYLLNAELVQLLVYLRSPTVVSKTMTLMTQLGPEPIPDWGDLLSRNARYGGTVEKMLADMPPVRAIHFAFVLRNAKTGWSLENRKQYFEFFIEAAKHPGGNSYSKFLMQFRDDAISTCTAAEKIVLDSITSQSLIAAPIASTPPKGPGRVWTKPDALATIGNDLKKRDFKAGHNLYHATSCAKCHRIGGEGGAIGPDLSTAAKKFSIGDMLDAIIEPSKAISDQYGSHQVLTEEGTVFVGRTVEIGDEYYIYTADISGKPTIIKKVDVDQITPSKLSQMPAGLIDTLNEQELKDLIAYLLASGDRKAKYYQ